MFEHVGRHFRGHQRRAAGVHFIQADMIGQCQRFASRLSDL